MSGLPPGVSFVVDERGIDRRQGSSDVSFETAAKLEEAKPLQEERNAAAVQWLNPAFRRAHQAALEAAAEAERKARGDPHLALAASHAAKAQAGNEVVRIETAVARAKALVAELEKRQGAGVLTSR